LSLAIVEQSGTIRVATKDVKGCHHIQMAEKEITHSEGISANLLSMAREAHPVKAS
jgi:hypothetical protein